MIVAAEPIPTATVSGKPRRLFCSPARSFDLGLEPGPNPRSCRPGEP